MHTELARLNEFKSRVDNAKTEIDAIQVEGWPPLHLRRVNPDHSDPYSDFLEAQGDYLAHYLPWAASSSRVLGSDYRLRTYLSDQERQDRLAFFIHKDVAESRKKNILERPEEILGFVGALKTAEAGSKAAKIGVYIAQEFQSQGYAYRSLKAFIEYVREEWWDFDEFTLDIAKGHTRSKRLATRLGAACVNPNGYNLPRIPYKNGEAIPMEQWELPASSVTPPEGDIEKGAKRLYRSALGEISVQGFNEAAFLHQLEEDLESPYLNNVSFGSGFMLTKACLPLLPILQKVSKSRSKVSVSISSDNLPSIRESGVEKAIEVVARIKQATGQEIDSSSDNFGKLVIIGKRVVWSLGLGYPFKRVELLQRRPGTVAELVQIANQTR